MNFKIFISPIRKSVPLWVLGWISYLEYAFSYRFCAQRVLDLKTRIGLIVGFNVLITVAFISWILVHLVGPGSLQVKVPPYNLHSYFKNGQKYIEEQNQNVDYHDDIEKFTIDEIDDTIDGPDIFLCNYQGFPPWCNVCQTIKVFRSHHSTDCTHCITCMDHYCTFLGGIIGQNNYRYFLLFIVSLDSSFILAFVSMMSYIKRLRHNFHWTMIVACALCLMFILMVTNLIGSNIEMIYHNETTIDALAKGDIKKAIRRYNRSLKKGLHPSIADVDHIKIYVNIKHPNISGIRLVVPLTSKDHPYNRGSFWANLISRLSVKDFNTVQQVMDTEERLIPFAFKEKIYRRIEEHRTDFTIFGSPESI